MITMDIKSQWPRFDADEIEAATEVLRSGKVNRWTGPHCDAFEREYAAYCGVPHAIALANGTVALELAMIALDIGPGDEVITTPRSFFATAGSIVLRGATPVFADVDIDSQAVTADSISACLTPRTKAVIVVHLAGWPADMDPIMALAEQHGFAVIEDCAQAHGARYKGRPVGSIGHLAAFSFCQDKIMTTGGEGGLLLLKDAAQWKKCWAYKEHGKSYDKAMAPVVGHSFRWLHEGFGSNWRLTEMQAAIGRLQLRKLDRWVAHRRRNAELLSSRLRALPQLEVPILPPAVEHAYYKYYLRVAQGIDRDAVQAGLLAQGIPTFVGACPAMYAEAAFQHHPAATTRTPVANDLASRSLMFQVDTTLDESHMNRIADAMQSVLAGILPAAKAA